jgi:dihydrofolate reductase
MRKIVACEWMSLDGVIQSPSSPEEDASGGFTHGGWHSPYFESESMQWVVERITTAGGFLFGRRTYDIFAKHWPNASEEEHLLAQPLNALPKYVVSTSMHSPLLWSNSILLGPHFFDEIHELRANSGGDLLVIGSAQLVHALLAHDLVDEFRLMIDPVCLGVGKRLFPTDSTQVPLRLISSHAVTTGALLVTYSRGG